MAANSLHLHQGELQVLRELQAGRCSLDINDPLWDELQDLHLVELRGVGFPYWALTTRGRLYKTD
jgi:hypothetical protein